MFNSQRFSFELICWVGGLVVLFLFGTNSHHHFSLCPLYNLGINWCPGCGLGRSVASFLHGDIAASVKHHWFGIPALIILLHRVYYLFRNFLLTLMLTKP